MLHDAAQYKMGIICSEVMINILYISYDKYTIYNYLCNTC